MFNAGGICTFVVSVISVYLKLPILSVSCNFGQTMNTSCEPSDESSQACFIERQKGCRTVSGQMAPLCLAGPPIVSPPSVNCSDRMSLVMSSLDLSQRRGL